MPSLAESSGVIPLSRNTRVRPDTTPVTEVAPGTRSPALDKVIDMDPGEPAWREDGRVDNDAVSEGDGEGVSTTTRDALMAPLVLTRPERDGIERTLESRRVRSAVPVVSGKRAKAKAATPATWGQAMLVPLKLA